MNDATGGGSSVMGGRRAPTRCLSYNFNTASTCFG